MIGGARDRISRIHTIRRRAGDERGVVLVLTAMLLVALLGMAALAIDTGSFAVARARAQAAADAAALAAADDLADGNASSAAGDATTYADTNDPGASVTISTPYGGSPTEAQITVNKTVPSAVGEVFGSSSTPVSATAVASGSAITPSGALFASDENCGVGDGITIENNSALTISGSVQSLGGLTIEGNATPSTLDAAAYGGPNDCSDTVTDQTTFSSGPTFSGSGFTSWPKNYSSVYPSACTYTASSISFSNISNASEPSGVYCATGTVTISNDHNVSGNITLIANSIQMSGNSGLSLTPYYKGLGIYQTGSGVCQLEGISLMNGTAFVPNGSISITNSNVSGGNGFIEAKDITISGNSTFNLTGSGPSSLGGSELVG